MKLRTRLTSRSAAGLMARLILQLSQFLSATIALHVMRNYLDLTGKTALITGASSGIGAAAATMMADLGAHVAIGYHANQAGAEKVRDAIAGAGGKAVILRADMRRPDEARAIVKNATDQLGPIDILVNNAGALVQ